MQSTDPGARRVRRRPDEGAVAAAKKCHDIAGRRVRHQHIGMARADDHIEVSIAIQVHGEDACGLVPGHIVVLARELARPIPQKDGHRAAIRVRDREIEFAVLIKVAGSQGGGVDGLGKIAGGAERAVAIAEQHGEILVATGHQVRSSVSVEVPECEGGNPRGRLVIHGSGEGSIPAPQ